MRLTVLGASGAWPTEEEPATGFLVEHEGFRVVMDLGYAVFPRLLEILRPEQVDAVLISHGHPDHCADLNPLLRARALADEPAPALPVYALPNALDAVLALDRPGMLTAAYTLREIRTEFSLGPFDVRTRSLPHFVPNAGFRLSANGKTLAYTGDSGPCRCVVELARGADLFLAEATHERVPDDDAGFLTSATDAGVQAAEAGVGQLVLTHLWPGSDPERATRAAARAYPGPINVARSGSVFSL